MAFWWVSQNKTYYEEKEGGYWETMKDVRKGDIIFSYYQQQIVAFSTALGNAYDCNNPFRESGVKIGK